MNIRMLLKQLLELNDPKNKFGKTTSIEMVHGHLVKTDREVTINDLIDHNRKILIELTIYLGMDDLLDKANQLVKKDDK